MGHAKTNRPRASGAPLAALATALLCLILAPSALAGAPFHTRAKALDVSGLNHACGVATDNKGDVYASSAGDSKIKVYDPSHALLTEIANANEPCGLAVDSKGNLYASERATGEVVRYLPNAYPFSGTPTYGSREAIDSSGKAQGIYVDHVNYPEGANDRLYVAEGNHVAVYKSDGGFEASILAGKFAKATGVATYTYADAASSRLNLFVADDEGDTVKVFSGPGPASLKLRRTITGVDQDGNPETPAQAFGFGAAGAYLGADPGNETKVKALADPRKCAQVGEQACTAGHFFLYDAVHAVIDEFDASGEYVDQFTTPGLDDAQPTQIAVDRSGGEGDGTIYAGSGSGPGAKLLAFAPLRMPVRAPVPALSRVLTQAGAVATDDRGDVYVGQFIDIKNKKGEVIGTKSAIRVYSPAGKELTSFEDAEAARDLAVDSKGNVYALGGEANARTVAYYVPAKYPPESATAYSRHKPNLIPNETLEGEGLAAIAVNPADDHLFAIGNSDFSPVIAEFKSAAEGSAQVAECGSGIGLANARQDIDVYGATGQVYASANPEVLYAIQCGAEKEVVREIRGGGCPGGTIGGSPTIAVDQANGHMLEFESGQGAAREYDGAGACVAEFGIFSIGGESKKIAVDSSCALHKPPLTAQTTPTCASFDPADGTVYVAFDAPNNTIQPNDVNAFGPLDYGTPAPPTGSTLTIAKAGTGTGKVECKVNGGSAEACASSYPNGTSLQLLASANPGSSFAGFSAGSGSATGCSTTPCAFTLEADSAVTASFNLIGRALTIAKAGTGTGKVECKVNGGSAEACASSYPNGTSLQLLASANPGSSFAGFSAGSGSATGCSTTPCAFTLEADSAVTASFNLIGRALTIAKAGTGTGKVECKVNGGSAEACASSYPNGTSLQLLASANPGSSFAGFSAGSGSATGCSTTPCAFTLEADSAVTASFNLIGRALTIAKAGTGTGKVECKVNGGSAEACASSYPNGTSLQLLASANPGSSFAGFSAGSGSATGCSTTPCAFTLEADSAVTASFNLIGRALTIAKAGTGTGKVECKVNGGSAEACASSYPNGTSLQLLASANPGSSFAGFSAGSGSATGCSTTPCAFTLEADSAVTASFNLIGRALTIAKAGTGTGKVECKVNGGSAEACASSYPNGTSLQLLASANPGSSFAGFSAGSGSATGCSTTPCAFTLEADSAVTASFNLIGRALTIAKAGTGTGKVECKVNGGSAEACASSYPNGTSLQLLASANPGSSFAGFSAGSGSATGCSTTPCAFTLEADSAVTASFNLETVGPEFALAVSTEGTGTVSADKGTISCKPFCEDTYAEGTKVTLSATPAPGSIFLAWKHCDSGGVLGLHCTVTMDKAKAVTAVFATGHALTVANADGSGLGKVQSYPAGIACLYNCQSTTAVFSATTKVTLKETPAKHFHFAGWSGDCTGTGACEVAMGADREVKALFAPNTKHDLTLARTGAGKGIVKSHPSGINCGYACTSITASFDEGEEALLEVSKVGLGYTFGGWSGGGCSGIALTCTVAIEAATEVKATFE